MERPTFPLRLGRFFSVNFGFGGKNCVRKLERDWPPIVVSYRR